MEIHLKALTPLWTGGVDRTCDRLHETGLIGSLRWWYEALVRGLGGYACDPTDESKKCKDYDPKLGTRSICAACYLFGTTGWARLFRLQVQEEGIQRLPLYFYTTLDSNKGWLQRIFPISTKVPFGQFRLYVIGRGQDDEYALSQLSWTLHFAANHGGIGAKLQHGFGQVRLETDLTSYISHAERDLKNRLSVFKSDTNNLSYPNSKRLFSILRKIPSDDQLLRSILRAKVVGSKPPIEEYIPCAFDLRYKGNVNRKNQKQLGFRQWLLEQKWQRDQIQALMGETKARRDDERSASRICFSMPWKDPSGVYVLRVFGFVPHNLDKNKVEEELKAYLDYLFSQ